MKTLRTIAACSSVSALILATSISHAGAKDFHQRDRNTPVIDTSKVQAANYKPRGYSKIKISRANMDHGVTMKKVKMGTNSKTS